MPPKPKPIRWKMWTKVILGGSLVAIGGPAFTMWLTPSEDELRARYNPDLRKRSLENREEKQQEFDDFVGMLKQYSKSDKHIWEVAKEADERRKKAALASAKSMKAEAEARREEMRREQGLDTKS